MLVGSSSKLVSSSVAGFVNHLLNLCRASKSTTLVLLLLFSVLERVLISLEFFSDGHIS